jgi:hypothetical protein
MMGGAAFTTSVNTVSTETGRGLMGFARSALDWRGRGASYRTLGEAPAH